MQLVAVLLHDDMDAHRLVQVDAVIVDETLGLEAAVGPFGDRGAHVRFAEIEQALETGQHLVLAEFRHQLDQPLLAEPARSRAGRACRPAPARACGCWRR